MIQRVGKLNSRTLNRTQIQHLLQFSQEMKALHQKNLLPVPTRHEDIENHLLDLLFEQAEKEHLQSHVPMNSWTTVDRTEAKGEQILDSMWVYVYKFDKQGCLLKSARSFRTFMAIVARFDLELKQYNTVNAFVHALLPNKVYM